MSDRPDNRLHFDRAQAEDLPIMSSLAASSALGSRRAVPLDVMQAWLRTSPDLIHVLRRGEEIVAYTSILPLPKERIMQAMQGKIGASAIPLDDIQPFTPFQSLSFYIVEAVVRQDIPDKIQVAARLITEIAKFLIRLTQQSVWVEELYAVAVTPYGIRVCRALGCQELHLPGPVEAGRIPFKLVVKESQALSVARWVAQSDLP